MKSLFILIILVVGLIACNSTKRLSSLEHSFTPKQMELISKDDNQTAMRVFLITNPEDSLLLRTKSKDFQFPQDKIIAQRLADKMLATVTDTSNMGVGIAAPQVGILKNLILVQRFDKKDEPFEAYYNPTITSYSKLKQPCLEGCLSIPNKMDTTRNRAYAILLEYDDIEGSHHTEMVEDFTAVIFQHEIDHLNGILFLDHLDLEIKAVEDKRKLSQHR